MSDNTTQPEPDPKTLAGFIECTDKSLAAWARRVESTEDIRMALAYGKLVALYEMNQIADRYDEDPRFMTVATAWAAGTLALIPRRDASRFRRMLERARAESPETYEGGSPPCSTT